MSTPRFAIACPDFYPRTCGVGDNSLRLAGELRRRGFEVEIFTRGSATVHPEASEIPVHAVPGTMSLVVAERIRRAIAGRGFSHLILQYTPHMWGSQRLGSPGTAWLAAAAKRAGMDVTVIAHELFAEIAPRPDLLLRAALNRLQITSLARIADRLFATTDTRAEQLMPFWRLAGRAGRPGVLRIGPAALPVPRRRVAGRCRLGFFSTFATTKRFDVALGAFDLVRGRRPECELILLGDLGHAEDRRVAAINEALGAHPARERIHRSGRLSLAEIAARMAEVDVYLFAMTTGANTRSSTLPVALGGSLPVVAVNGIETDPALFHDGENVLFAEAMTGEAFGKAALRIIDDPALADRLSIGARRLYDQYLSWPDIGDTLLAALGLGAPP